MSPKAKKAAAPKNPKKEKKPAAAAAPAEKKEAPKKAPTGSGSYTAAREASRNGCAVRKNEIGEVIQINAIDQIHASRVGKTRKLEAWESERYKRCKDWVPAEPKE